MNFKCIFFVIALLLSVTVRSEAQRLVVIVNKNNPISDIPSKELQKIFTGDVTLWEAGTSIQLSDWKSKNSLSNKFYDVIVKISPNIVRRRWLEKVIVGNLYPPLLFSTEKEFLEYVSREKSAIGYMDIKDIDNRVKTLSIDGEPPESGKYKLK